MTEHRSERDEFKAVAAEFCELYQSAPQAGGERFLRTLDRILPRLHAAAVALPFSDDEDELPEDDLDVSLSVEERQAVDFPVAELLDKLDWSRIEERLPDDPTVSAVSLYDDLSDIHADLKDASMDVKPSARR